MKDDIIQLLEKWDMLLKHAAFCEKHGSTDEYKIKWAGSKDAIIIFVQDLKKLIE